MQPFPLIRLAGGAYERGLAYGRAAADRIALVLEIYRRELSSKGLEWHEASALAIEFAALIRNYDSELMTEVEGIAAGARGVHVRRCHAGGHG